MTNDDVWTKVTEEDPKNDDQLEQNHSEQTTVSPQPFALLDTEFRPKISPGTLGELQNEQFMVAAGRERYLERKKNKITYSDTGKPKTLIDDAVGVVTEAIKDNLSDLQAHQEGAGRRFSWMKPWEQLISLPRGAEVMALAGLKVMMDAVAVEGTLNSTLVQLGKTLEMELWAARLREFDKKLHKRIEDKVRRDHVSLRYRTKAAKIIAAKEGFSQKGMKPSEHVKLGSPLYNVIMASTEIFEVWTYHKADGKTVRRIGLTEEAAEVISEYDYQQSWMSPFWQPMIVPPNDWEDSTTGAYLDASLALRCQLVKGANKQQWKLIHERTKSGEMRDVYDALNLIQKTPYVINDYVLEAVNWAWDTNQSIKKFPQRQKIELQPRPDHWDDLTEEQRKGWIIDRRKVVMTNRKVDGNNSVMKSDLQTAHFLSDFSEFYIPHNMDFRGRVYPISTFNYQRDSHIKAMFKFARAKPIGEQGFKYLALKVADLGDFDKVSKKPLADRLQWVLDNEELVYKVGNDYVDSFEIWSKADKPFEFLAACHEYTQVMLHGFSYKSGLPIGLDGSNSAAQHYSAASRSYEEGRMVNLTVETRPQDVYQVVAERVIHDCKQDSSPMAKLWLDYGITRSIVKRQTMTFGYGSVQYGFANQIRDDLMKPLADEVTAGNLLSHPFGEDDGHAAARFMADKVWAAVNATIFRAAEGMQYFKDLANACSSEDKLMHWSTPLNFPVVQRYQQTTTKKIKLYLHDSETSVLKRVQVSVIENVDERAAGDKRTDTRKNRTGASPNVIHSMDACHLQMTVLNCVDNYRIRDFFLIHDSFGVMPADCPGMYKAVRESFVDMYTNNCLYQSLRDQIEDYLDNPDKADLPSIPEKGSLDLREVLQSEYCFI
tara:strand:+ start:5439 stop:8093 length:2655 start_codon:yes stop_codon:yes gene_type:complete